MTKPVWTLLLGVPVLAGLPAPASATDYLSIADAQRALFPQAQAFTPFALTLTPVQLGQIKKVAGTPQHSATPKIWRAVKGGSTLGWMIVDEVIGKHEYITYSTAISPDGHVLGVEIMSYRESHGGEIRNPAWRAKFRDKTIADRFKLNQDIPNISGATLSSRNVTDGVKRLLAIHAVALSKA
jgi:Na+-translocating ferredoxin:NAD+ oxidoreductase RnfG subunit